MSDQLIATPVKPKISLTHRIGKIYIPHMNVTNVISGFSDFDNSVPNPNPLWGVSNLWKQSQKVLINSVLGNYAKTPETTANILFWAWATKYTFHANSYDICTQKRLIIWSKSLYFGISIPNSTKKIFWIFRDQHFCLN